MQPPEAKLYHTGPKSKLDLIKSDYGDEDLILKKTKNNIFRLKLKWLKNVLEKFC